LIRLSVAQDSTEPKPRKPGEFYFSWGYNRDWYSKSDIHIYRHDADPAKSYDFWLHGAKAHDKPDMDRYWDPGRLTIPQYDLTAGYFFNDKRDLGIEVNWNHLKYVVTDWQMVHMSGQIHGNKFDMVRPLSPDTLHLQHTNGNNYLLFNLVKRKHLLVRDKVQISAIAKVGIGPMISYTIDTILGDYDSGYFHYHGMVGAMSLGVRATFFKYLFLQTDMQGAFANYTNTKLGHDHLGRARHHFYSSQWTWEAGVSIPIAKK
jgi:hypothetical protein